MAQVILSSVGRAIGGPVWRTLGAQIGAGLDRAAIAALQPARQTGPRLSELRVMSSAEGAGMAAVFGRARVAGQVIWAARFREKRVEHETGGGKGGPKVVEYRYSLSFAVALCEGPIDGLGRVWADGKPMDLSGVTMRLHRGDETQAPDALIAAIEDEAPAYRGCAYVVFEDLPLAAYGNRPPQLSFEVFRRPPGEDALEARLKGVCLIPGAGEFMLATEVIHARRGLTRMSAVNVNNGEGRPDLLVSLDQLQARFPALESVTLVVAWFGASLDAGDCQIRPGVEQETRQTHPWSWRAGGVGRGGAHRLSRRGGAPAYGGTPADRAVLQAIAELKARGLKVTLHPFLLMDCEGYPWRGRISGEADDVLSFFGSTLPGDLVAAGDGWSVEHHGAAGDWGLRRMVLHYARLATLAGGVDGFLIGSELRGVTAIRDGDAFPAVEALRSLAVDCRAVLGPDTAVGYAADWSEYFGHQPADGSGDVFFHLDPLWADPAIDFIGVDFYPPLSDWRGEGGPDAATLAAGVAGGEGFDWFYASEADRLAGRRAPITDGAHGEPWVFRPKDLVGWWSNAHHDRPRGVRSASPTGWVPMGKPIRLTEFGCAAIDKGANAPNLFLDPKSAESAPPPFSSGLRDDMGQRRALEAVLAHFGGVAGNPVSPVYEGRMVEAMSAWCWDARPFPDFPARGGVWADSANWATGHWLNGRAGAALGDLVRTLGERAGVVIDPGDADGLVTGYVIETPMRLRDVLAPLAGALAFDIGERDGRATLIARDGPARLTLTADDQALEESGSVDARDRTLETPADTVRLRFIDEAGDYQIGGLTVRRDPAGGGDTRLADLPLVMAAGEARRVARRLLARERADQEARTLFLAPLAALRLEPGDRVRLADEAGIWRVERIDLDERPRARLVPVEAVEPGGVGPIDWTPSPPVEPPGPPVLHLLDLPPLPGAETDARPLVAAACEPWPGLDVHAGIDADALTLRARLEAPAIVGETLEDLSAGPLHRLDRGGRLVVRIEGASLESRPLAAVLAGANALAVHGAGGEWEVVQFLAAEPIAPDVWRLTGLLRGQGGSDPAMAAVTAAGAPVVLLREGLVRASVALSERGLPLLWRAAPAGGPPGGSAMSETTFTWRGLALRPWTPAHLRREPAADGAIRFSWVRRARLDGDGWDGEPPLAEEREVYRLEILDGDRVVRAVETAEPGFLWTAEAQAADFPAGTPDPVSVAVAQGSARFGWGAPARRVLWQ